MQVYPAIDLKGGCIVRAPDGDVVYHRDPAALAARFVAAGASWLHVVDLDRAFGTGGDNSAVIRAIVGLPGARVQLGGLLATLDEVDQALALGAARVVVGTQLALDHAALAATVAAFGAARLGATIDVRRGRVTIRGSSADVALSPAALVRQVLDAGIRTVVYRDLAREGTLRGSDLEGAARLIGQGADILLSGGAGTLEHLRTARAAGLQGVIVGRALYEGGLDLEEALTCLA